MHIYYMLVVMSCVSCLISKSQQTFLSFQITFPSWYVSPCVPLSPLPLIVFTWVCLALYLNSPRLPWSLSLHCFCLLFWHSKCFCLRHSYLVTSFTFLQSCFFVLSHPSQDTVSSILLYSYYLKDYLNTRARGTQGKKQSRAGQSATHRWHTWGGEHDLKEEGSLSLWNKTGNMVLLKCSYLFF